MFVTQKHGFQREASCQVTICAQTTRLFLLSVLSWDTVRVREAREETSGTFGNQLCSTCSYLLSRPEEEARGLCRGAQSRVRTGFPCEPSHLTSDAAASSENPVHHGAAIGYPQPKRHRLGVSQTMKQRAL